MKKKYNFLILFNQFINASKSGKRLKKDGSKIRHSTIQAYITVRDELLRFSLEENFELLVCDLSNLTENELKKEKLYWKDFYIRYLNHIYARGGYDNYAGHHFKVIRTFFNYLKTEKLIFTGDIHKGFYVRRENVPIVVVSPEQLQFLIYDEEFKHRLPGYLERTKDVFIFGCTVGLRFSDLMKLTKNNLETTLAGIYLRVRSIKTSSDTKMKLPAYAIAILNKYRGLKTLLPVLSNNRLNINIKELCELAGWTFEVGKQRQRRGVDKTISRHGTPYRFCDLVTTHTMRRTSITILLSLGMPEVIVRKISGHSEMSKDFYRYVNYAQQFIDKETERVFHTLAPYAVPVDDPVKL